MKHFLAFISVLVAVAFTGSSADDTNVAECDMEGDDSKGGECIMGKLINMAADGPPKIPINPTFASVGGQDGCYKKAAMYCVGKAAEKAKKSKILPKEFLFKALKKCRAFNTLNIMLGNAVEVGLCVSNMYAAGGDDKIVCAIFTYREGLELSIIPDISLLETAHPAAPESAAVLAEVKGILGWGMGCMRQQLDYRCNEGAGLKRCPRTPETDKCAIDPNKEMVPGEILVNRTSALRYARNFCHRKHIEITEEDISLEGGDHDDEDDDDEDDEGGAPRTTLSPLQVQAQKMLNANMTEGQRERKYLMGKKLILMNKKMAAQAIVCLLQQIESYCGKNSCKS